MIEAMIATIAASAGLIAGMLLERHGWRNLLADNASEPLITDPHAPRVIDLHTHDGHSYH